MAEKADASKEEGRAALRSVVRRKSADSTPEMDKNINSYIDFLLAKGVEGDMSPYYVSDPPDIRNTERTGYPWGEPRVPRCPVCGEECETIYYDKDGEYFGCDQCVKTKDASDESDCFADWGDGDG